MTAIRERLAPAPAGQVGYLEAGPLPGEGAPLALVHDWACDAGIWEAMLPALRKTRRVVALDLPGHGRSSAPTGDGIRAEHWEQAVLAMLDHARLDRVVLAGHGLGGLAARMVAARCPARVAGVALFNGSMFLPPPGDGARSRWEADMLAMADLFAGPDAQRQTVQYVNAQHSPQTPSSTREAVLRRALATPSAVRLETMRAFLSLAGKRMAPTIPPVLAVYTRNEDTPANLDALLREAHPRLVTHVVSGAGHYVLHEQAARCASALLSWLREQGI